MAEAKDKKEKVMGVSKATKEPKAEASVTKRTMLTGPEPPEEDTTETPAAETAKATSTSSKIKIEPLSKPEDLKPESEKESEVEVPVETAETEDDTEGRDKLKDISQEELELQEKKAAERQANYDKIATAKTYYLPINQVVRRRSKQVAIIGALLAVLLGLAWLDVALDAGLITIPGVKAPTSFFSN